MKTRSLLLILYGSLALGLSGCQSLPPGDAGAVAEAPPVVSEGEVVVADGVTLYYRAIGQGDDTLMVPNAAQMVDLSPLARGRRVVLYDSRGRGRSSRLTEELEIGFELDLADLEALRAHLGAERVSLLGGSYYGALVALYAARHPERVDRLVMVGPLSLTARRYSTLEQSPSDDAERQLLVELGQRDPESVEPGSYCREYYRLTWPRLVGDPSLAASMPTDFCKLPNEWPQMLLSWGAQIFTSMGIWDWSEQAASVESPALVIQGDRDRIVPPAGGREWAERLPQARLLWVEGTGHVPLHERPSVMLPAIDRFLNGDWPRGAEKVP